jgi:hypothetical protein
VPAPPWLAEYHRAIALYRGRDFSEGCELFARVNAELGGGDFLCQMYRERCAEYLAEGPPMDWDGSYTLKEK